MIRRLLLAAASVSVLASSALADPPPPPPGRDWQPVFSDEFDGQELDRSTWNVRGDYPRDGGFWRRDRVSLDGRGHLVLLPGLYQDKMATGAIDTQNKRQWRFGYFEVRAKLPMSPAGHRPAFWLQSQGTFGPDPVAHGRKGTEIDVFEAPGRSGVIEHNLHWETDRKCCDRQSAGTHGTVPIDYTGWHTFGLWWTPSFYRFYVDGQLSWETSAGGVSQVPEYVLITDEALEVDKLAPVHAQQAQNADPFVIDYFRVWSLTGAEDAPPPEARMDRHRHGRRWGRWRDRRAFD